jgi:hypothetical protein
VLSKPPRMVEVRAVLAELTRDQTPIPAAEKSA